ncbi:MAG: serine/threonine-protein kinase [Deltaproteobacteria bacterium]|nr:serine/threonine-protein kinase [Deltaproteobacteria bacterium]
MSMKLPYYLGKYELTLKLAEGGMAEIYLARYRVQDHFQKDFAIKLISPKLSEDPSIVPMLIDEANIQSRLSHDNIVKIFELGVIDQPGPLFFLVMEYVKGINLAEFIRKMKAGYSIPTAYKIYIVHEILKGLQYAHSRRDETGIPLQIVHRDISPQNILLSYEGRVKIADFGIARARLEFRKTATTQCQTLKGKYAYMSPEQAKGSPFLDHRSDLFSTGAIFFELLTGLRAFDGENDLEILDKVREGKFNRDALCSVEPELKTIIEKSLMTDSAVRYSTASEFSEDLWKFMCSKSLHVTDQGLGSLLSVPEFENSFSAKVVQQKTDLSDTEIKEPDVSTPSNISHEEDEVSPVTCERKRYFLYVGIMTASCLAVFLWSHSIRIRPEPIRLKPVVKKEMQLVKQGALSVVSDIWAHAKIGELTEELETPFHIVLNAGAHSVRLWRYEGERRFSLELTVTVEPEKQLRCYAVFQKNPPKMACN